MKSWEAIFTDLTRDTIYSFKHYKNLLLGYPIPAIGMPSLPPTSTSPTLASCVMLSLHFNSGTFCSSTSYWSNQKETDVPLPMIFLVNWGYLSLIHKSLFHIQKSNSFFTFQRDLFLKMLVWTHLTHRNLSPHIYFMCIHQVIIYTYQIWNA